MLHFVAAFAIPVVFILGVGALALVVSPRPIATATTLRAAVEANGDEYLAIASGGYTGEALFLGTKSLMIHQAVKLGGHTEEVVVSSADGCVYVTDREQSLVRVIDPSNADVLGQVYLPKGVGLPHVAVSRDGEVIYIADEITGAVLSLQPRRGVYRVGSPALPGSRFQSVALTHDGQRLLIADYGLARIVVLSTNPLGPLADVQLNHSFPHRIRIAPNDQFALATDELLGEVSVLALAHSAVSVRMQLEPGAFDTAISADGKSAYVSVWPTRHLFQIDLESWRSRRMATVPFSPGALDVSPDGRYVVVTERLGALEHLIPRSRPVGIALVDTGTGDVVKSAEFAGDPHAIRFLPMAMPAQPACPGFRNGEWALITTSGVPHG